MEPLKFIDVQPQLAFYDSSYFPLDISNLASFINSPLLSLLLIDLYQILTNWHIYYLT